jgi:hypothetical protein
VLYVKGNVPQARFDCKIGLAAVTTNEGVQLGARHWAFGWSSPVSNDSIALSNSQAIRSRINSAGRA